MLQPPHADEAMPARVVGAQLGQDYQQDVAHAVASM